MSQKTLREFSIEELFERAHAGDDGALAELFKRSQPILSKLKSERQARSRPGGAGPSDIVQETAKLALEGFATFTGTTEAQWNSWLRAIFLNCLRQLHRAAGRKKRKKGATLSLSSSAPTDAKAAEAVPAPGKSPSQAAAHNEDRRRLLASLYQLPSEQGRAIWLRYMKELPMTEVAQAMGKTEAAVVGLLYRGQKALQRIMADTLTVTSGDASPELAPSQEAVTAFLTYLTRLDAGEHVGKESFLAEYPGCGGELRAMLDWIERVQAIWGDTTESEIRTA